MPISVIAVSGSATSTDYASAATSPINTTGATAIILLATYGVTTPLVGTSHISDNKSSGNPSDSGIDSFEYYNTVHTHVFFYLSPNVGSGHTFTLSGPANCFPTIHAIAVSGLNLVSPLDKSSVFTNSNSTASVQPGSVTPSEANEILITGLGLGAGNGIVATVNAGFTLSSYTTMTGFNYGGGMGYKIQTSIGAENPTWSWSPSGFYYAPLIVTLKAAPVLAGLKINSLMLVGAGR